MILTGETLLSYFEKSAEDNGKIFFQTEKDEANAKRICQFFSKDGNQEIVEPAIHRFMSEAREPVVFLLDFVVKLGTLVEDIKLEMSDREEFRKLVRETQERMKGESN